MADPRQTLQDGLALSQKEGLLNSATPRDRSRLLSASGALAGAYLHALPLAQEGLRVHPAEFRVAVRYRLGLPVLPPAPCSECGATLDQQEDHAVSCATGPDRKRRHNRICRIIGAALASAGHTPRYEDPHILPHDEHREARPADIATDSWSEGGPTAFDITVVSPTAPTHVTAAAAAHGATAKAAESHPQVRALVPQRLSGVLASRIRNLRHSRPSGRQAPPAPGGAGSRSLAPRPSPRDLSPPPESQRGPP